MTDGRTIKLSIATALTIAALFGALQLLSRADVAARLSFLGSVVGAAITVIGSIFAVDIIEGGKRRQERAERRRLMLELLDDVERSTEKLSKVPIAAETFNPFTLYERAESVNRKVTAVQEARKWITPDGAAMVRAFGYIGEFPFVSPPTISSPQSDRNAIPLLARSILTHVRAARRELQS